jgi:superoxide dismutase, Cu-Zn family
VPFEVEPGDRAVVVHAEATAPNGTAGPRLACLPVVW